MIFQFIEIIIAGIIVGIIYLIIFVVGISKATSEWVKNYRFLGLLPVSLILMGIGAFFLFSIARIISIGSVLLSFGLVLLITSLVGAIVDRRNQIKKSKSKEDYWNLDWLKHQYYDLGRTIQDIADDQNVSMITIRKWLDELEGDSKVKE